MMKLLEGSWYSFTIENITALPEKGNYYVLKHESGRKMLLDAQYYVKYNLGVGQSIECRVDKVNCTGQIFLEPKHPFYSEGSLYSFKQLGIRKNEDNTLCLLVKDYFENDIEVFINTDFELTTNGIVQLKVERIKKGKPILSFPIVQNISLNEDVSDTIKLRVVAVVSENTDEFFSLADDRGKLVSRLKVKHYKHYGFKIGSVIICQKRGYDSNGLIKIEPENPWYKVGKTYFFRVISLENFTNLEEKDANILILNDINDNKSSVMLGAEQLKKVRNQVEVKCKVVGFKKGRPLLEIDPDYL